MKITGSELSRRVGVSRQAVSKATKQNILIRDADKKYDLSDPTNKAWIRNHKTKVAGNSRGPSKPKTNSTKGQAKSRKKPAEKANNKPPSKKSSYNNVKASELSPVELDELLGQPQQFHDMTLKEMVLQFGNFPGMKSYAELLDKTMSSLKKSVEIQKIKHELIERTFFVSHVKVYINLLSEQLFDYAGTDKKMLRDFEKMINHAQQNIDRELGKLQKMQEAAIA